MGNLAVEQVAPNQASPEVTVNDGTLSLDKAVTESFLVDLTSGNVTITTLQYQRNIFFNCANVATGGRTVTLTATPPKRSAVIFECPAANTNSISLIAGSTTLTLLPGRTYLVRTDGTANGLVARDIGGTNEPGDMSVFVPGAMVNNQLLYRRKMQRSSTLPINLTGSNVTAKTAATGSTTVTLKNNGSSIGTAVWSGAGTVAALTFAAPVTFAVGDVFTIEGPATADATLADVSFDLLGTRP
jgi:hypothetical protein